MANNETVKISIATVGTDKAVKDTKSLKQQIRELRDELGNLTQGTDEYNQKVQELGNLMHQQREITEQAKRATEDYGQTLNNLSTVASGVVGSITAVQGVMSLLGTENEDATKTIKTMTSLMGILQGLSALDACEKTMGRMWTNMKKLTTATNQENVEMKVNTVEAGKNAGAMAGAAAATKAQGVAAATTTKGVGLLTIGFKNLGRAIKAFMVSNPFTLILLGLTTAITLVERWISKTKEEEEEMKKLRYESQKTAYELATSVIKGDRGETSYDEVDQQVLGRRAFEKDNPKMLGIPFMIDPKNLDEMRQYNDTLLQIKQRLQELEEQDKKFTLEYKLQYDYMLQYEKAIKGAIIRATQASAALKKMDSERATLSEEERNRAKEDIKQLNADLDGYYSDYFGLIQTAKKYLADEKKEVEAAQKERTAKYKEWQDGQRKLLDDEYNRQKTEADNQYKAGLISAEDYYNKLKKIEDDYLKSYIDNKKRIGLTQKEEEVFTEAYRSKIIDINKSLQAELRRICEKQNDIEAQIKANNLELETERAEETLRRSQQDQQALAGNDNYYEREFEFAEAWIGKKLELIQQAEDQQYQIEYEANQKHLQLQIERLQKDMEFAQEQKRINDENEDLTYGDNVEQLQMQKEAELQIMQTYAEQTKATEEQIAQRRTEIEEEYDTKLEQLRVQHLQNLEQIENDYITDRADSEYQLSEYIYQLHENEYNHEVEMFQKKQQLTRTYLSAFSTMVGGVQGLLSELQGAYEQGSKQYEAIEEANIIMSGITGALQAWQSGMAAAPAPWNLAIAAAMSGISVATTIAALANLKNKKLSTSASQASLNITPYETVATETGAELNGQIQDTRVIVVESDIEDVARRVFVAESEASF